VKNRTAWLGLLAIVAVFAVVVALANQRANDAADHSTRSDGPNGASALVQLAQRLGHSTRTQDLAFTLPDLPAELFVFNPDTLFSRDEAAALDHWVRAGGVLVYADDNLDTRLATTFGLRRGRGPVPVDGRFSVPALAAAGGQVTTDGFAAPFVLQPDQAALVRYSRGDQPLVIEQRFGQGRVIAIAAPELLCNRWIADADNYLLAADLVSITPGPVVFDEFHHGVLAGSGSPGDWTREPLGLGLGWGALAILLLLTIRGRTFGPRIPVARDEGRSAAEYASAVGGLLRRSGGRSLALRVAVESTRRALSERLGLGGDVPQGRLHEVLARRAPALAEEYSAAAAQAAASGHSEAALLAAARRLHALAYPMARNR